MIHKIISKLDSLLSSAVYKPLSLRPRYIRGKNLFLPLSVTLEVLLKSIPVTRESSPKALILSSSTISCPSQAALSGRISLDQKPIYNIRSLELRLAQVKLENKNLLQAKEVLYKQNSDYSNLLQEYRTNYKELIDFVSYITDSIDVLEQLSRTIRSNTRLSQDNI